MKLFTFVVLHLLMDVQSQKSPAVKVSPDVIRESSTVKIICETSERVDQCYFYTNREVKNINVSSSCELDLTGAEVLRWAAVKSPESIDIYCYFTIENHGIHKPSSHSTPATVTVLDSLQKPSIGVNEDQDIISCEIPLSVEADFICSFYTEDGGLLCQRVSQRSSSGEKSHCMYYLSHSELFTRSVNRRRLSCVYSSKTEPEIRSPHSDTITLKGLPLARLSASASVILETDTVQLSCENTEDLKMNMCYFYINERQNNSKPNSSCKLSLTGSQISIWSGGQSSSVRIICFYTVMNKASLHSDPVTVQISPSTITEQTTTTMKTSSSAPPDSTRETQTYSRLHFCLDS
ncbi:uncharacterized protein LOC122354572 isoform X1 [Puntigrus tetrazona]|uniref:uncharacterized protein LOC122354572 isoform X1 n=1 Tax=Puntigrus tetrazona TaxID=1606681 RepID=UPI001C8A1BA5|nr:uncharacterized protein LOC122354572 isoform X1 [Puntigrus tetrazona]